MNLKRLLTRDFSAAFKVCGYDDAEGEVNDSQRKELGQFQCNSALALGSRRKANPRQIAQQVLEALPGKERFSNLSLAGPGFINITLTDEFLAEFLKETASDEHLGCERPESKHWVLIDFGGPNVAKPMHVGHLRSSIIGESLKRICRFMGDDVIGDIHMGDWGTQMGMLICEMRRMAPHLPYFDEFNPGDYPPDSPVTLDDLEQMYPRASARCKEDENEMKEALKATTLLQQKHSGYYALWTHFREVSVEGLKKDFEALGVTFDLWKGESDTEDRLNGMVERLKAEGHAVLSEGAYIIPVAEETDQKEVPPMLLVKSDGGFLYGTTDLATIEERVQDLNRDLLLYVVDKRQANHFVQVFRAAKKTGIAGNARMEHIGFGTVNGPDGKPFKTRAGGVMRLSDLIAMVVDAVSARMVEAGIGKDMEESERADIARKVGVAALKLADLQHNRESDYVFELDKFTKFEGYTGPYLLYQAVRIKSIFRKNEGIEFSYDDIRPAADDLEREWMLRMTRFAETVESAYQLRAPHHLCEYAFSLAQLFSRFYDDHHILKQEDPAVKKSWLALCRLCLVQLERILELLGMEVPDRM